MGDLKQSKYQIADMPAKRGIVKNILVCVLFLAISLSTIIYKYRDYFSTQLLSCLCSCMHGNTSVHKLCCRHQMGSHHVPTFQVNLVQIVTHQHVTRSVVHMIRQYILSVLFIFRL